MFYRIFIYFVAVQLFFTTYLIINIPDSKFHIYFVNVGQGDCIFIKTVENHQILIDAGAGPDVLKELEKIIPYFDRSIDLLILTHPHEDHYGGFINVLENYNVDFFLLTGVNHNSIKYERLIKKLNKNNVDILIAHSAMDINFGDFFIDIIYPFDSLALQEISNLNNSSIVMMAKYKDISILLTGDIEKEIEEQLANNELKANILKIPHHGSDSSSSIDFLKKISPDIAIIQSGKNNKFGHPHEETLKNLSVLGIEVLRNDKSGTLEFIF